MIFEWDENKNLANIKKHKISFKMAAAVFQDEHRLELFDDKHSTNEERYIAIGKVEKVLYVVYTYKNKNIHIISARLATKFERSIYYEE